MILDGVTFMFVPQGRGPIPQDYGIYYKTAKGKWYHLYPENAIVVRVKGKKRIEYLETKLMVQQVLGGVK